MASCLLFCKRRDRAKPPYFRQQDTIKSAAQKKARNDMERAGCTDLLCAARETQCRYARDSKDATNAERLT